MADGAHVKVDIKGWETALENLSGSLRVSLARSMAVAGGTVIRDEAKARAPRGPTGLLGKSIYLAYRENQTTPTAVHYSVTWNRQIAPHGHLVEFGHWQTYQIVKTKDGRWLTRKNSKLKDPKWVAANPFLRPAYEAASGKAAQAMIERARVRLPELLAEAAAAGPAQANVQKEET